MLRCHYAPHFKETYLIMLHAQSYQATRRGAPGSNPGDVLGGFQATCCFWSLSFALESTRPLIEMSTMVLSWRISAVGADSSALLVCAEYEIKDLNPTFHRPLRIGDLLWETFTFHMTPIRTLYWEGLPWELTAQYRHISLVVLSLDIYVSVCP